MTIVGVLVGVLIVAFVAMNQLGSTASGTFKDPAIKYPAALEDHTALGKTTAPVTLEIYGDFQCPICANSALNVEPLVVSKYVVPGTLRLVHHDIAILGGPMTAGNESRIAASGAVCADQQGKYWDYAHWVFNNQAGENAGGFARDRLTAIARSAGLDTAAFTTCLDAAATLQAVDANAQAALGMGIDSTPTMYVNGVSVGAGLKTVDQLSVLIDAALAKASASPAASGSSASPAASVSPATSPAASASTTP